MENMTHIQKFSPWGTISARKVIVESTVSVQKGPKIFTGLLLQNGKYILVNIFIISGGQFSRFIITKDPTIKVTIITTMEVLWIMEKDPFHKQSQSGNLLS